MKNRAKRIIAIGLLLSTVFTCSIPVYAGKEYFAFTTNAVDKAMVTIQPAESLLVFAH